MNINKHRQLIKKSITYTLKGSFIGGGILLGLPASIVSIDQYYFQTDLNNLEIVFECIGAGFLSFSCIVIGGIMGIILLICSPLLILESNVKDNIYDILSTRLDNTSNSNNTSL